MSGFLPPSFLVRIATGKNVLLLIVLFVAFSGFIMPSLEADIMALSGGVGVIDLQLFYTPNKVFSMLSAYGPQGTHLYIIAQWTVDLVFPIIAGLMFATLFLWLGQKQWWWLGPFVTLVDWVENVFVTLLLVQFPDFSPPTAWAACVFTSLKWATIFFSNSLILFHGGKKLLARRTAVGSW